MHPAPVADGLPSPPGCGAMTERDPSPRPGAAVSPPGEKATLTPLAIASFVVVAALGPLYTVAGYSPVANVISELAAQSTPRNYVMAAAFLGLGVAIVVDGVRAFRRPLVPFIAFGLAFAAAGLFGHRPIAPGVPYTAWVDATHSALATVSGVALTVGFGWQAAAARTRRHRSLAAALAVACVGLPLLMLQFPPLQGLVQRAMYLAVFAWLWAFYPAKALG